ncbi:hypothetical protein LRD18_11135 [Halorhodospira halochloris]|uniref:hypothetical protein n=1 Tax=Halorhodospira halochloris TaxID=1052 RepID=UPI001EE959CA|nr:hypothetical protein [Halorhodospira halochloris]MCG5531402.1 hypothetical protein [Halorhodospira halochloris]
MSERVTSTTKEADAGQPPNFCKLFVHPKLGQILVLLDEGAEQGPEVRLYCRPSGVSVCTATFPYPDTPEGLLEAQGDFEAFDEEQALEIARQMFVQMAAYEVGES